MQHVQALGIAKGGTRCARCKRPAADVNLYKTRSGACSCRVLCGRCIHEINNVATAINKKGG